MSSYLQQFYYPNLCCITNYHKLRGFVTLLQHTVPQVRGLAWCSWVLCPRWISMCPFLEVLGKKPFVNSVLVLVEKFWQNSVLCSYRTEVTFVGWFALVAQPCWLPPVSFQRPPAFLSTLPAFPIFKVSKNTQNPSCVFNLFDFLLFIGGRKKSALKGAYVVRIGPTGQSPYFKVNCGIQEYTLKS